MYRPFTQRCVRITRSFFFFSPVVVRFSLTVSNVASQTDERSNERRERDLVGEYRFFVRMAEDFCQIGRSATRTATFQRLTTTNVFNETRLRLAKQFFWNSFFAQRRYIILPALLRIRNCEVVFSFSFTFVVIDATRIKECFRECEDIMRERRELWTWTGNCRNVETFPLVWTNRLVDNGAHKHNLETALLR